MYDKLAYRFPELPGLPEYNTGHFGRWGAMVQWAFFNRKGRKVIAKNAKKSRTYTEEIQRRHREPQRKA